VLSGVQARSVITVSVSPQSSQFLAKLRPCVSLCTEGDNNTPLNPPLAALLTQSIPHGVERSQVVDAKFAVALATWICHDVIQVQSGSLDSNKADLCWR